jgi:hypothetical protein
MRSVGMILLCLIVPPLLFGVIYLFFRALNKIEVERWGDKAKADTQESFREVFRKIWKSKM